MKTTDGLLVLAPGEGQALGQGDIIRMARASDTGGRWGAVIVSAEPGEDGRTHIDTGEHEAFFILEGSVILLGAESATPLEAGSFVLVPPDTEHGLRIVGETEARWLAIWPSALDGLFEELASVDPTDADAVAEIRRRHGVEPGRDRMPAARS